ncbi:HNH endonuclease, partial [Aeromonas caviae]
QAGKWDQETIVSFFLCQYCSGEYLRVLCNKDLSGTLNLDNVANYDHIVPLSNFGFNDISNMQLLCKECNQNDKHGGDATTSSFYHSWY